MLRLLLVVFFNFSLSKSIYLEECNCPSSQINPTLSATCGGGSMFMNLIDSYIHSQCDIEDPCGRPTPRFITTPESTYDFIVVGAGSAGSVVASRLSENSNWKVLLIEAGGDEPTGTQVVALSYNFLNTSIDWKYQASEYTGSRRKMTMARGKVLGGTSVLNGMMYMRGTKEDYAEWEALGNSGWNYEKVLEQFKKAEDNADYEDEYHSKGGLQAVGRCTYLPPMIQDILDAGVENGLNINDLNGENSTGIMISQFTQRNGVRRSSARSYLRPARNRSNLHIMVNSRVTKVLIEYKVAKGVQVSNKNREVFEIQTTKEVILSAGFAGSPQILLLSGVGPEEHLTNVGVNLVHELPGVGRNLQDHVSFVIDFKINQPDVNTLNYISLINYMKDRSGPLSSRDLFSTTAKIASPYSDGRADIQFYFYSYLPGCSKTGIPGELNSAGQKSFQIIPVAMKTKSKGYVQLKSSDPFDYPRIVGNYLQESRDFDILLYGVKFAVTLSKANALEKYKLILDEEVAEGCEGFDYGFDDFWNCTVKANYRNDNHQIGTCKMGPSSDPMAVVDERLSVRGIQGLRVIDASIMPSPIAGNTHAPTMMIGEMGSKFVKEDWDEVGNFEFISYTRKLRK